MFPLNKLQFQTNQISYFINPNKTKSNTITDVLLFYKQYTGMRYRF